MSNNREEARRQLDRLADALARDLDCIIDDELFEEAAELYGTAEAAISETRDLIESAITNHAKSRFTAARQAYEASTSVSRSKVLELPWDRKRALINKFSSTDNVLQEKLTMAARNEEEFEVDIDSFLEDLFDLGVIDNEGNVL